MPIKARITESKSAMKSDPNIEPHDHNAQEVGVPYVTIVTVPASSIQFPKWVIRVGFGLPSATSGLPLKADLVTTGRHVSKVPIGDIAKVATRVGDH